MKKIYGNSYLLSVLDNMNAHNKAAHSLLICGEKGCGKKLIADRYTASLLCESPVSGAPCGVCSACRSVEAGHHPDVTYAETSGKLGGYSVDTARSIIADAFVKPNNSTGRKVYQFRDCRNMDERTQNTLLKLIEEPPDYAYFIFTAVSKYEFLPTIISRCICLSAAPCTEEEAESALAEEGFTENDIKEAVSCFHGNIGMCREYISQPELKNMVGLTKKLADSIIRKDEYSLSLAMCAVNERNDVRVLLSMTDKLIRDAAVIAENSSAPAISCDRKAAVHLAEIITPSQAEAVHRAIERAWKTVESNVMIPLALEALCGEIMDIAG